MLAFDRNGFGCTEHVAILAQDRCAYIESILIYPVCALDGILAHGALKTITIRQVVLLVAIDRVNFEPVELLSARR